MFLSVLTLLLVSFTGCRLSTHQPESGPFFALDLTGPITIAIAFDARGKTLEQWAAAEEQIDWDSRDESPKQAVGVSWVL